MESVILLVFLLFLEFSLDKWISKKGTVQAFKEIGIEDKIKNIEDKLKTQNLNLEQLNNETKTNFSETKSRLAKTERGAYSQGTSR